LRLDQLPYRCIHFASSWVGSKNIILAVQEPRGCTAFKSRHLISKRDMLLHCVSFGKHWTYCHEPETTVFWTDLSCLEISGQCVALRVWAWIDMLSDTVERRLGIWRRCITGTTNVDQYIAFLSSNLPNVYPKPSSQDSTFEDDLVCVHIQLPIKKCGRKGPCASATRPHLHHANKSWIRLTSSHDVRPRWRRATNRSHDANVATIATRGHTVAHVRSAKLAEKRTIDRYFPASPLLSGAPGTGGLLDTVCFECRISS
jgi:hypothetical protein